MSQYGPGTISPRQGPPPPDQVLDRSVLIGAPPAPPRTLWDVFTATAAAHPDAPALDVGGLRLGYRALRAAVEETAVRLAACGVGRGDRVGIRVPSGTPQLYIAILATLRRGAAYVPVDSDDPHERARTVFTEAAVCVVVEAGGRIVPGPVHARRIPSSYPGPRDDAWIIFTSGSTGKPKGVAVTHRGAAAFVDAEARLFARDRPLGPGDRVLAGLSVAFDASCEEMWLAWRHGACLVPAPRALVRSGAEFGDWLVRQRITVVSTVPTLASLWTADQLRGIRLLILGGEACPEALAHRLAAVCPEVWNTYGPTEATVVACAARLGERGPVRIGLPLAGWLLAVVDPAGRPVPRGEVGELLIAGVGTARYLDREKDRDRFVPVPGLGWRRAYRSGDLVRADPGGLSFVGRADGQVKIRGFRVELSEIEAVLADLPGVVAAAVTTHEVRPSVRELVAYYCTTPGLQLDDQDIADGLRARLPAHMVPAYYENLPALPSTTSGKVDRAALPAPTSRGTTSSAPVVPPSTPTETELAALLGESLGLTAVSVESHLIDDLQADSLALAQFAARVRERRGPSCPVGMRLLYRNPTVRALAEELDRAGPAAPDPPAPPPRPLVGGYRHLVCGAAQLVILLVALAAGAVVVWADIAWMALATGFVDLLERSISALVATFVLLTAVPVLVKWTLVGRWRPAEIPLWSAAHLRFWLVATLVRTSPMALFAGSPLYLVHLRMLGAKVGRGVVVLSRTAPVCTDMLTIGDGAVIRAGSSFTGYRVERGAIVTGPVSIGRGAVVSDGAHLDIDTVVGADAQLGHASALPRGARVPDGTRAHGSPAVPTTSDFRGPDPARCSRTRRAVFSTVQLLNLFLIGPVVLTLVVAGLGNGPRITAVLDGLAPDDSLAFAVSLPGLGLSLAGSTAALLIGLLLVAALPRLLWPLLRPGRVYPLYGAAYWCHRTISRLSNVPLFVQLYGDSSYIVGYLRWIGYRIARGGQTGSNFGAAVSHEVPNLVSIGPNTMVSDGVAIRTAEFTSSSFGVVPVTLGADCFLGNMLIAPAGDRIGDGCLVGTKTMIPTDGPVRNGTGLLGSPAFEIPRNRPEDPRLTVTGDALRRALAAKDRHNLVTMALFLLTSWVRLHIGMTIVLVAAALFTTTGPLAIMAAALVAGAVDLLIAVLVERAITGFRRLTPQYCSIYDRYFWWHERFWKLSGQPGLLNGTPFKPLFWRLLGARVGRRVYDDGASMSEKTLVSIGDDVVLGAGVVLQAHSMEDGIFKSDHIRIGDGCVLGGGVFVHYDTGIGDDAVLAPDSFLMKGERVGAGSMWAGNPAAPTT